MASSSSALSPLSDATPAADFKTLLRPVRELFELICKEATNPEVTNVTLKRYHNWVGGDDDVEVYELITSDLELGQQERELCWSKTFPHKALFPNKVDGVGGTAGPSKLLVDIPPEVVRAAIKWNTCDWSTLLMDRAVKTLLKDHNVTVGWLEFEAKVRLTFKWGAPGRGVRVNHSVFRIKQRDGPAYIVDLSLEQFGWSAQDWFMEEGAYLQKYKIVTAELREKNVAEKAAIHTRALNWPFWRAAVRYVEYLCREENMERWIDGRRDTGLTEWVEEQLPRWFEEVRVRTHVAAWCEQTDYPEDETPQKVWELPDM